MDKYNQKWVSFLFLKSPWAITLGQTTYYSCSKELVSLFWRQHEDTHKKQWKEDGWLKFGWKYLLYNYKYGYDKNPYEVKANANS